MCTGSQISAKPHHFRREGKEEFPPVRYFILAQGILFAIAGMGGFEDLAVSAVGFHYIREGSDAAAVGITEIRCAAGEGKGRGVRHSAGILCNHRVDAAAAIGRYCEADGDICIVTRTLVNREICRNRLFPLRGMR
jgi:hypothetical protein